MGKKSIGTSIKMHNVQHKSFTKNWFCNRASSPLFTNNLYKTMHKDTNVSPSLDNSKDIIWSAKGEPRKRWIYADGDINQSSSLELKKHEIANPSISSNNSDCNPTYIPETSEGKCKESSDEPTAILSQEHSGYVAINTAYQVDLPEGKWSMEIPTISPIIYFEVENPDIPETTQNLSNGTIKSNPPAKKQRNFCYFCETYVLNFERHYIRNKSLLEILKFIIRVSKDAMNN